MARFGCLFERYELLKLAKSSDCHIEQLNQNEIEIQKMIGKCSMLAGGPCLLSSFPPRRQLRSTFPVLRPLSISYSLRNTSSTSHAFHFKTPILLNDSSRRTRIAIALMRSRNHGPPAPYIDAHGLPNRSRGSVSYALL